MHSRRVQMLFFRIFVEIKRWKLITVYCTFIVC